MITNTLVVGYGGFGCNCVTKYADDHELSYLMLNPPQSVETVSDNVLEIGADPERDLIELQNIFKDYRNIFLVSSMGGDSFESAYRLISDSASILKIPMVSLCTMPYMFETDRRARASENLRSLIETSRNIFVIDSQKTISENLAMEDFLNSILNIVVGSMDLLYDLLEHSSFYTLCSDQVYTLALAVSGSYSLSLAEALGRPYYELPRNCGKVLICTDGKYNAFEKDGMMSVISTSSSMLPEFITFEKMVENSVLLFIPISFRQHE